MAIYRGEGGATDVEAAPGNTEFAGGIIVEKDAVVKGNLTVGGEIYGDGSNLTGVPSVEDTYTKDEVDASQAEQDVVIDTKLSDAPNDGVMYARKDSSWQTLPVGDNVYTKAEIDAQQSAQDVNILTNNDDIARQQIEITNNTANITKNDEAINTNINNIATNTANIATNTGNISSNTTAIGTLSGQVSQNSEDIAELQNSIFFTSAYSADYPSNPNRDPEDGNMYLQNYAMFTYSYAEATQIFCSKTDESGNVRQFTAIKPGDSIVLNEVDSPNYGRYELVTVEDVSDSYVVMTVIPKMGQGTVITGVKVAFQAFPKPGSGTGDGIPEAPIDGKQYGRQDAEWTEVTGGGDVPTPVSFQAYCSTDAQVFTAGTTAQVAFDVFEWDTNSGFDSATSSYTPNVAGYYQVNASIMQKNEALIRGTASIWKNDSMVAYASNLSQTGVKTTCPVNTVVYCNGVDDKLYIKYNTAVTGGGTSQINSNPAATYFNATLMQGVSGGGSGGGGSTPTPEDMAWSGDLSPSGSNERLPDTVYTNDNDVPLYVQIYTSSTGTGGNVIAYIDGEFLGRVGTAGTNSSYDMPLYIVPSGSTYEFKQENGAVIQRWREARMPLAIAVGGGGGGVPSVDTAIGMVAPFAMDSVPTGWLHCDGSEVSRTTYSLLYSKVGDIYGAGDGSTTFNLPNLQDEFIRGSSDTLPVGNKQDDEFKEHDHINTAGGASGGGSYGRLAGNTTTGKTGLTGGEETRPRNVAMLYCINATAEPSSGSGSYTPEALVWEDKTADRAINTEYTNTQDVPIYVTIAHFGNGATTFIVDEKRLGRAGNSAGGYFTETYVVPSGSKYKLNLYTGTVTLDTWNEARMPVAVGTGGKTVAFRAEMSADQTVTADTWTKVNLDTASVDTNNSFADGKFQPSVAGYYQVNGCIDQIGSSPSSSYTICQLRKNTEVSQTGSGNRMEPTGQYGSFVSVVSDLIYLNGEGDFVELFGKVKSTGTSVFSKVSNLSAVLVSGGSASGDSIWTEEGGTAVYDGDIKVNGNVILPTVNNTTFLDNKQGLVWNTETGQIFETDRNIFSQDITVNGVRVGMGGGAYAIESNTVVGNGALNSNVTGSMTTAIGHNALKDASGGATNTAVGAYALGACTGSGNTSIGESAGSATLTGDNNTLIGSGAQPSASDVSNEVTIGNGSVTSTRLRGNVVVQGGNVLVESSGNTDIRAIAPSGQYATLQVDNADKMYSMQVRPDENNYFIIRDETGSQNLFTLGKDTSTGKTNVGIPNCRPGSGAPANMNMDVNGNIFMLTDARSVEEVEEAMDKKLAIKDKLIEKLSARLDELEQKFNNGGGK